jgi:hypothetical protein
VKKPFFLLPVLLLCFSMMAQPPKGPANKGMIFGEKTTPEGAVNVDDLGAVLGTSPGTEIKVKGKVVAVCKVMGCWLKMQTSGGAVMIKMKDESFFVPLAVNGKTIIAKGIATIKETSVKTLRHYAEDAGSTKKQIAAIREPKKEITMEATGILVL